MNENDLRREEELRQEKEVRQMINAEETFTLAKDIFDMRTVIKKVYNNRALISKRLNTLWLIFSMVYTALYIAYILTSVNADRFSKSIDLTFFIGLGVYLVICVFFIILTVHHSKANTKVVKKYNKILRVMRYAVKVLSLIISIFGLIVSSLSGEHTQGQAIMDGVFIVFSIMSIVVHGLPIIFGGLGGVARWLMSPVKRKVTFAEVALEWYRLVISGNSTYKSVKKVDAKYFNDIERVIDGYLIPQLGKKRIVSIGMTDILAVLNNVEYSDLFLFEGVFKNIFSYAETCKYIGTNPCKNLNLTGSIEKTEKVKNSFKDKITGKVKKAGMSILDKFLSEEDGQD